MKINIYQVEGFHSGINFFQISYLLIASVTQIIYFYGHSLKQKETDVNLCTELKQA